MLRAIIAFIKRQTLASQLRKPLAKLSDRELAYQYQLLGRTILRGYAHMTQEDYDHLVDMRHDIREEMNFRAHNNINI